MKTDCANFDHLKNRDLHVHTIYCQHAEGSMEEYIIEAIDQGLDEIGFLAHAEAGIRKSKRSWLTEEDLDRYWEEGKSLQCQYKDCIMVSIGLEMGLNPEALLQLLDISCRHPWDRIGLSYHYLLDGDDAHHSICSRDGALMLKALDSLDLTLHYYEELRKSIRILKPDMLCHLDVIRKHIEDRSNDPRVKASIKQLLAEMERSNVALEINTAGYDFVGEPYPARWIIREAVERGVELVMCSDSHKPNDVGRYFNSAADHIRNSLDGAYIFPIARRPWLQAAV